MLKVFIVDDEKLVRQGLISTMPWKKFNMQVVGEASNGEEAMQFLEQHEIHLLLVDLVMPGMTGLELVSKMKHLEYKPWTVIITCHQDFAFIQEALRLGAIDYIVKTQLEQERMEDVLGRISNRIYEDPLYHKLHLKDELHSHKGHLLLFPAPIKKDILFNCNGNQAERILKVDKNAWYLHQSDLEELERKRAIPPLNQATVVTIEQMETIDGNYSSLCEHLYFMVNKELFYSFNPNKAAHSILFSEIKRLPHFPEPRYTQLRDLISAPYWLFIDSHFHRLISQIERIRPPKNILFQWMHSILNKYTRIFLVGLPANAYTQLEYKLYWSEWKKQLTTIRQYFTQKVINSNYSEEIMMSIIDSMVYVYEHLSVQLSQSDVAQAAHMSRGYFSRCFKGFTGKSFRDYVRQVGMNKAKHLMDTTKDPIYLIAEKSGFLDVKYFSKIFKAHEGILPNQYKNRSSHYLKEAIE